MHKRSSTKSRHQFIAKLLSPHRQDTIDIVKALSAAEAKSIETNSILKLPRVKAINCRSTARIGNDKIYIITPDLVVFDEFDCDAQELSAALSALANGQEFHFADFRLYQHEDAERWRGGVAIHATSIRPGHPKGTLIVFKKTNMTKAIKKLLSH